MIICFFCTVWFKYLCPISIGALAKLVSGALLFIFVLLSKQISKAVATEMKPLTVFAIENGDFNWNYSLLQLIEVLLLAPIIENLVIPLIFSIFYVFKKSFWLPALTISILAYFAHTGGVYGITPGFEFFVFCVYYNYLIKHYSSLHAYFFTVITHSSSNLLALGFSIL